MAAAGARMTPCCAMHRNAWILPRYQPIIDHQIKTLSSYVSTPLEFSGVYNKRAGLSVKRAGVQLSTYASLLYVPNKDVI